ncbi:hypothetical protein [Nocardioides dilutus]
MARIPSLNWTLSTAIPFARGVADRAVRTAGPIVVGVAGRVSSHLPRRSRPAPSPPETFTPAPAAVDEPAPAVSVAEPAAARTGAPSPAIVARNVAGPRPTAKSPAKRKPRSVPGAKLPVTRPST